jgi:hypothetical protein
MAKPKIRIVSEGNGRTTRVLDAETGEDLTSRLCVSHASWEVDAKGLAKATLTLVNVAVDVVGELES